MDATMLNNNNNINHNNSNNIISNNTHNQPTSKTNIPDINQQSNNKNKNKSFSTTNCYNNNFNKTNFYYNNNSNKLKLIKIQNEDNNKNYYNNSAYKKDEFILFHKPDKKDVFGYDYEKLQDTILKLKKELNIKNKEINSLKVELNLLSLEDKKKLKIIEDILANAGKSFDEIINILDGESKVDKINLNANSIIRLREIYVINFLKNQVNQLKNIVNEKTEEIDNLKSSSKVCKVSQLEEDLKIKLNENEQLKLNYENLYIKYEATVKGLKDMQNEHQILYKKYLKKEREYEKTYVNLTKLEQDNKSLVIDKKKADENTNKYKISMINMKADLKYKTDIVNYNKNFEEENIKLNKEKEALNKKLNIILQEKKRLNNEIK